MKKTVWFVRHAQSKANAGEKTSHTKYITLTETGLKQALVLPQIFDEQPDLIATSSYVRTQLTAQNVIYKFKYGRLPTIDQEWHGIQEFTYLCAEKWKDSSREDREPARSEYWKRMDPLYSDGVGAERFKDFIIRIHSTLGNVQNSFYRHTLVFTHGQFMKALWWVLIRRANNRPQDVSEDYSPNGMQKCYNFFNSITIPNTGILKVEFKNNKSSKIQLDCSHIKDWTT